jgi:hypothetical protein
MERKVDVAAVLREAERALALGNYVQAVELLEPWVAHSKVKRTLTPQLERDVVGLLSTSYGALHDEKSARAYSQRYQLLTQELDGGLRYGSAMYSAEDEELYRASLLGEYESPYGAPGGPSEEGGYSYASLSVGAYSAASSVFEAAERKDSSAAGKDEKQSGPTPAAAREPIVTDILARFYWNERLQLLLERTAHTPEEARRRSQEINALMERFVAIATPLVEQIVRSHCC